MSIEAGKITVFTKPACGACEATKRRFTKNGVEFETVDVTQHDFIRLELGELGFQQLPVVQVEYEDGASVRWSGYEPDYIDDVANGDVVTR